LRYKNPHYQRVRGSSTMLVSCGHCRNNIVLYQKVGKGALLRMYVERIVKGSVDLSQKPGLLICPHCKEQLAMRVTLRRKNKEAYIVKRGALHSRFL